MRAGQVRMSTSRCQPGQAGLGWRHPISQKGVARGRLCPPSVTSCRRAPARTTPSKADVALELSAYEPACLPSAPSARAVSDAAPFSAAAVIPEGGGAQPAWASTPAPAPAAPAGAAAMGAGRARSSATRGASCTALTPSKRRTMAASRLIRTAAPNGQLPRCDG